MRRSFFSIQNVPSVVRSKNVKDDRLSGHQSSQEHNFLARKTHNHDIKLRSKPQVVKQEFEQAPPRRYAPQFSDLNTVAPKAVDQYPVTRIHRIKNAEI